MYVTLPLGSGETKEKGRNDQFEEEPMKWEEQGRQEMLERVRIKKLEWAATAMRRSIALDIINKAAKKAES